MPQPPLIAIVSDHKIIGDFPAYTVVAKYVRAVQESCGDVVIIPAVGDEAALARILAQVDGIALTGSPSNIEPKHYGEGSSRDGTLHDPQRDATTLPLIRLAVAKGVPVLGICRGFQEINVALGGSLCQHVQEEAGRMDHREPDGDIEARYADAHVIHFTPGSHLQSWLGKDSTMVNSLHEQGVKQLAPGLVAEAHAPDGMIEAFRAEHSPGFVYAAQWHPEWLFDEKEASRALFAAFQEACANYRRHRLSQESM